MWFFPHVWTVWSLVGHWEKDNKKQKDNDINYYECKLVSFHWEKTKKQTQTKTSYLLKLEVQFRLEKYRICV